MKLQYGLGKNRVFEVDKKADYLFDNGACIMLCTNDATRKGQWKSDDRFRKTTCWTIPPKRFERLLKQGFIKEFKRTGQDTFEREGKGRVIYYSFTDKIHMFEELFK